MTKRPPTPPVTRAVIFASIGLTLAYWFGVDPVRQLAGPGPLSEPWRLLTATLLHGGMLHLVFNVLWVWQFGLVLELTLGAARTVALFTMLAVVSSLVAQLLEGPGIGLSGVVYGLFTTLWVAKRRGLPVGQFLSESITKLLVAWFFIAIAINHFQLLNMRIGNVAHAAGALAGCLAGLLLPKTGTRQPRDTKTPGAPEASLDGRAQP